MKSTKNENGQSLKPLQGHKIQGERIRLREKKLSDVRNDYNWQRDPELARFDAVPVLDLPFALYLLDYTAEIRKPHRSRFSCAIETLEGKHIGNCTCYEIDEKKGEAQFGIMIGDGEFRDKGYGLDVVRTMIKYVFENTAFDRIYLKTLDWNLRAQKCFIKSGFKQCGELKRNGYTFMLMEIFRADWEKGQNAGEAR
ncbi:MAG TPA: GNAT family N-acetyltransferase [Dehalococcoidales bacterium]|nr:GNAT family N-acetyltransferase [Dehalococcoidales bacterium]